VDPRPVDTARSGVAARRVPRAGAQAQPRQRARPGAALGPERVDGGDAASPPWEEPMKRLVLLTMLLAGSPAFADGVVNDCTPNHDAPDNYNGGCTCDGPPLHLCLTPDMAMPLPVHDMSIHDLASPPDARRERRLQRNRASGRGLVLLSGLS